jgi:hypothetical protein
MTPGADVRAIDALRDWLAALATYRCDAAEALSGIRVEISRGLEWVSEQLHLWQRAIRVCEDEVVQAKAELAAKRFPNFDGRMPDTTVEERNLRRAQAKLDHAQDQVRVCRKWLGQLPKLVDEMFNGPANKLANLLDAQVARGSAQLERRVEALERYTEQRTDYAASPASAPTVPPPPPSAEGSS